MQENRIIEMTIKEVNRCEILKMTDEKQFTNDKEQSGLISLSGILGDYCSAIDYMGQKGSYLDIGESPAITE